MRTTNPNSLEQNKPWLREGISRASYYRRKQREEEQYIASLADEYHYDEDYDDKIQRSYKASLILNCSHAEAMKICR